MMYRLVGLRMQVPSTIDEIPMQTDCFNWHGGRHTILNGFAERKENEWEERNEWMKEKKKKCSWNCPRCEISIARRERMHGKLRVIWCEMTFFRCVASRNYDFHFTYSVRWPYIFPPSSSSCYLLGAETLIVVVTFSFHFNLNVLTSSHLCIVNLVKFTWWFMSFVRIHHHPLPSETLASQTWPLQWGEQAEDF